MPVLASAQVYGKTATGVDAAIGATTPTASTGVLTFSGQPANGETITVGPFTYRWTNVSANATGQVPYYVLIGTNTAASIVNLAAAINGTTNRGVTFSNLTVPNPLATAVATSGTVLTVTATNPGADGNGFATTSATANATWGATTSTGGISASLNVTATVTPSGTQNVNLTQVGGAAVTLGTGTPAQSLPTTASKWVRHSQDIGASGTVVFPDGCIYSYVIVTGTAGDGTMTGLPAGFSDSSQGFPIVTGFTLTTASASSAKAVWFTAT